ncbi:MAG: hypothetical protein NTY66_03870, partial [Candidatus Vogelbacteria bacterium]|nr:hypothetical protein [Candidatus Vogelbacteria bacterium]
LLVSLTLATVTSVRAGSLSPLTGPGASGYTLSNIYDRLTSNASATAGDHPFAPSGAPAGSFHTLTEIYNSIPTIDASKLLTSATYLGVTGTYDVTNLTVGNVKSGTTFGAGQTGTLLPNGGTATAADVFNGKTANLTDDWSLDSGTLNLACNTATFDGTGNNVADGYDGAGDGTNRWCIKASTNSAVAANILSGKKAWVDGVEVSGTMANIGQQIITPGLTSQTITQGYHDGTGSVAGDADLTAPNIANGVNIFGVTGTGLIAAGNAGAGSVLETATFSSSTAINVTGTIPVKAGNTLVASSSAQGTSLVFTIPMGYYSGVNSVTVSTSSTNFLAANIRSGTNLFGLIGTLPVFTFGDASSSYVLGTASASGTALVNLWNGTRTDGGFAGGSQANAGVDDYNNAKTPATDRYVGPAGWTQCNSSAYDAVTNPGGNYCNTGESGADAKDNSTGQVWSLPCNGTGCSSFSDASPGAYYWAATSTINAGLTAPELCSAGAHGRSGWTIPHQKQLMQAYIDGSYGNLEAAGVSRYYWSGTTVSNSTANAWVTGLSYGGTYNTTKLTDTNYLRCVRSAP